MLLIMPVAQVHS